MVWKTNFDKVDYEEGEYSYCSLTDYCFLHSNEENREHWKHFWNVHCVLTNHVRYLVTAENEWVAQSRKGFGSQFVSKDLKI